MRMDRFWTSSLRDPRIARILVAALEAVEPGRLVSNYLERHALAQYDRIFLLGIGKAAEAMTLAAAETLRQFTSGLIITKSRLPQTDFPDDDAPVPAPFGEWPQLRLIEAGHPLPDERSLEAAAHTLDFASKLHASDLLLCLISGGASALVVAPVSGVTLEEIRSLTTELLGCGATIDEINIVRRQIDRIKGGGLAASTRASILSLILSDVIGDRLEVIASGPTSSSPTGNSDALNVLEKYRIKPMPSILAALQTSRRTPPTRIFERVRNVIVGSNMTALEAAWRQAQVEGFFAEILQTDLQGEAADVGQDLARRLRDARFSQPRPFCLVAGGETTVSLGANGKGGRNQEVALAAVDTLAGLPDTIMISFGTDGNDGPTDAAGAVVTGETSRRASSLGLSSADHLARHDSYAFFDGLGDLLKPGYTGTNVSDLMLLVAL